MWGRVDGEPKIVVAKDVMSSLVRQLPDEAKAGLIAYDHHRKGDCMDIESLVALGPRDAAALLGQTQARTPIARSRPRPSGNRTTNKRSQRGRSARAQRTGDWGEKGVPEG